MRLLHTSSHWRLASLAIVLLLPLAYLLLLHDPIPQDQGYHRLADLRACLGISNCGNVASNIAFLIVGVSGVWWCATRMREGARLAWSLCFASVTLVFAGSVYYHAAPDDGRLVGDRLTMSMALMSLFAAIVSEHLGLQWERKLLYPALAIGMASVWWWRYVDDLRVYVWVQGMPLLAIPLVIALFPARFTHRHYLLVGLAFYAVAKAAEYLDQTLYDLSLGAISGHSLKHMLAALAPLTLLLMLQRRNRI